MKIICIDAILTELDTTHIGEEHKRIAKSMDQKVAKISWHIITSII